MAKYDDNERKEEELFFIYKDGKTIDNYFDENYVASTKTMSGFLNDIYKFSLNYNKAKINTKTSNIGLNKKNNSVSVSIKYPKSYIEVLSLPYFNETIELTNISMKYKYYINENRSFFPSIYAKYKENDVTIDIIASTSKLDDSDKDQNPDYLIPFSDFDDKWNKKMGD